MCEAAYTDQKNQQSVTSAISGCRRGDREGTFPKVVICYQPAVRPLPNQWDSQRSWISEWHCKAE